VQEPLLDMHAIPAASPAPEAGPQFILEPETEPELPPGTEESGMPQDALARPEATRSPHARRLLLGGLAAGLLVTVLAVTVGGDGKKPPAPAPTPAPPPETLVTPYFPPPDTPVTDVGSQGSQVTAAVTGGETVEPATKPKPAPSASRKPRSKPPKPENNCNNPDASKRDASCVFKYQ